MDRSTDVFLTIAVTIADAATTAPGDCSFWINSSIANGVVRVRVPHRLARGKSGRLAK